MAVNLKQLAIVTSAYTGIALTKDMRSVSKYVSDKLGRQVKVGELRDVLSELRPLIQKELVELWDFTGEPEEVEVEEEKPTRLHESNSHGLRTVLLQLSDELIEEIQEEADSKHMMFDELIEAVVKAHWNQVAIKVGV